MSLCFCKLITCSSKSIFALSNSFCYRWLITHHTSNDYNIRPRISFNRLLFFNIFQKHLSKTTFQNSSVFINIFVLILKIIFHSKGNVNCSFFFIYSLTWTENQINNFFQFLDNFVKILFWVNFVRFRCIWIFVQHLSNLSTFVR